MIKRSSPASSSDIPDEVLVADPATSGIAAESIAIGTSSGNASSALVREKKTHEARIEHRVPGRIRIKIPSAKNNSEILDIYKAVFNRIPSITKVMPKCETGSIVIHYDPKREAEFQNHFHHWCMQQGVPFRVARPGDEIGEIANEIEAEATFLAERSEVFKAVVDLFKNLDYQIRVVTDNKIDLKIVLGGSLAAFTFIEIGAEAATPMWVTLALFAANQFIELKREAQPAPVPFAALSSSR